MPRGNKINYEGPEADAILKKSFSRWQSILSHAKSLKTIPDRCFNLEAVLSRVPCLPKTLPRDWSIKGYSTWHNTGYNSGTCDVIKKREYGREINLRMEKHIICTISPSSSFQNWKGAENNGLTLLVLGWAYVLAINLAERTKLKVALSYRPLPSKGHKPTKLDLEYATLEERAWWKALVSDGVGWTLSDCRITPWTIFARDIGIDIAGDIDVNKYEAPTSQQAACYLSRFCDAYGLGNQLTAAFATAITLTLYGHRYNILNPSQAKWSPPTMIKLPRPRFKNTTAASTSITNEHPAEFSSIGYYMTLSLEAITLGSCLWTVFYEPDIPCTFAGAWVGPIASLLDPILQAGDMELFAKVFSFSKVAPLWLGVAICGPDTSVIEYLSASEPYGLECAFAHTNANVAAWAGIPESFLSIRRLSPPVGDDGMIFKTDIWRLRRDCDANYTNSTLGPFVFGRWPPYGEMRSEDVDAEIRKHLWCSHDWKYGHWTWLPSDITDEGFRGLFDKAREEEEAVFQFPEEDFPITNDTIMNLRSMNKTTASLGATCLVFWWYRPPVEKAAPQTVAAHESRSSPSNKINESEGRNVAHERSQERVEKLDQDA